MTFEEQNSVFDQSTLSSLATAQVFIRREYLDELSDSNLKKCAEKADGEISLLKIKKIVYDVEEPINGKIISVYSSVKEYVENIALLLHGQANGVELYLGVRKKRNENLKIATETLRCSLLANFPGSEVIDIPVDGENLLAQMLFSSDDKTAIDAVPIIESISMIPSLRSDPDKGEKGFVQGTEKLIDTMRGKTYTLMILASPIDNPELSAKQNAYADMYSALSPFVKKTIQHGHNDGKSLTDSISETVTNSISNSIANSVGYSYGEGAGSQSGFNVGGSLLASFGMSEGINDSRNQNNTEQYSLQRQEQRSDGTVKGSSTTVTLGTSDSISLEYRNKPVEFLLEQLDMNLKRIREGASYGLWNCAAYLIAESGTDIAVAAGSLLSLWAGDRSYVEPPHTNVFKTYQREAVLGYLKAFLHPHFLLMNEAIGEELRGCSVTPAVMLSGKELPVLMSLPRKSVAGVQILQMCEFGRNLFGEPEKRELPVGCVVHMDNEEANNRVSLQIDSLTSHCFITGATGCGKSNTVYRILEGIHEDSKACWNECVDEETPIRNTDIHFLVIEPSKGEYRRHFMDWKNLNVFGTNANFGQVLRINPFYFNPSIHILEHLDRVIEIFNNCWEMYAAMPAILKEAIERVYVKKGWDLLNSCFIKSGDPVYPTFDDLLTELPKVIKASDYSSDTKGDYTGALVTRVKSLTNGLYGQIFCDDFNIPERVLFDQDTIVDLSRIGSAETKSLIMGVLILQLTEYRMAKHDEMNAPLRHITVIEEAHNLLKNTERIISSGGSQVIAKSVEMIVNSIAEMRTYGEGFIIVDQSPSSVDVAAIKNTNTKIIMRLPEQQDCEAIGHSVSLTDSQIRELSRLKNGCAVVMQNNWNEAVLVKVDHAMDRPDKGLPYTSPEVMRSFRGRVLEALIDEFAYKPDGDIEKVKASIESFDITDDKKTEMRRYIDQICVRLRKKFSSILFGKSLRRIAGCAQIINNSERVLVRNNTEDKTEIRTYTSESLVNWYHDLLDKVEVCVDIDIEHRKTLLRYILYAQQFEYHGHDYRELFAEYDKLM